MDSKSSNEDALPDPNEKRTYQRIFGEEVRSIEIMLTAMAALNANSGLSPNRCIEPPVAGAIIASAQLAILNAGMSEETFVDMCRKIYSDVLARLGKDKNSGLVSEPGVPSLDDMTMFDLDGGT